MKPFDLLLYVPFILQAAAIAVDEFYFHHRRGLPRWEVIGHPVDTLSVVACYAFVLLSEFNSFNLGVFIALSAFSCFLVTKDEFVHQEVCTPMESWLHAILFVLHPLSFVAAGFLWSESKTFPFLTIQTGFVGLFLAYQIFYWGFYGARRSE